MAEKKGLHLLTKIGHLWLKKNILRALVLTLIIILVQIVLIVLYFSQLPPSVPLYYSRPWGQAQLAEAIYLFLLPSLSLIIFVINSLLASLFVDHKEFYSHCLIWVSTIFSVFNLITLIKILQITL